ncbi:hypothetical protein BJ508DRAFT_362250 [Ascobolus immersus RN42]|uniref:NACHT domain-containing protein n=1 Tax=Ascobolus immersus RN42 TaxID=1160509 RepID=A0A3N4I5V5_ASCIM|nr:hypothetical protein BJ508DRAFT_362250 [Ascobolus immersus RN42]
MGPNSRRFWRRKNGSEQSASSPFASDDGSRIDYYDEARRAGQVSPLSEGTMEYLHPLSPFESTSSFRPHAQRTAGRLELNTFRASPSSGSKSPRIFSPFSRFRSSSPLIPSPGNNVADSENIVKKEQWRRAYEIAFKKLNAEEKINLPKDLELMQEESIFSVMNEAEILLKEKEVSSMAYIDRNGNTVHPREKLDKLLRGFNAYAKVVDVAIGHQPEIVALVWGSVRFLLQIYLNHRDAMDALTLTMEKISSSMASAEWYARIYSDSLYTRQSSQQSRVSSAWNERILDALPQFYAAVLVFVVKARAYFMPVSTFGRIMRPLKPFSLELGDVIAEVDIKEGVLKELAYLASMSGVQDIRKDTLAISKVVDSIHDLFSDISDEKAKSWLNAADPSKVYKINKDHRLDGTCAWILEELLYRDWVSGVYAGNLWIVGIPGAGKSVLASAIIDHLNQQNEVCLLYFFFLESDSSRIHPTDMAAGLVAQLLNHSRMFSMDEYSALMRILKDHIQHASFFAHSQDLDYQRDYKELCDLLLKMITYVQKRVLIVLDALDECSIPKDIVYLIELVDAFASRNSDLLGFTTQHTSFSKLQILLTGRPVVSEFFVPLRSISTIRMEVNADILRLVEKSVEKNPSFAPHKDMIIRTIHNNSAGMFRYAALLLQELQHFSPRPIEERLRKMPKELFGMYERILTRLAINGSEEEAELRRRVLLWTAMGNPAPTIGMLQLLCVIVPGDPSMNPSKAILPTREQILASCGSLVESAQELDSTGASKGEYLRFTHRTVREFLFQDRNSSSIAAIHGESVHPMLIVEDEGNAFLALSLLTQLLSAPIPHGTTKWYPRPPYDYSASHWHEFMREVPKDISTNVTDIYGSLWELVARFLWDTSFAKHHAGWLSFLAHEPYYPLSFPTSSMYSDPKRGLQASTHEVLGLQVPQNPRIPDTWFLYYYFLTAPEYLIPQFDLVRVLMKHTPTRFSFQDWVLEVNFEAERTRYNWDTDNKRFSTEVSYDWYSMLTPRINFDPTILRIDNSPKYPPCSMLSLAIGYCSEQSVITLLTTLQVVPSRPACGFLRRVCEFSPPHMLNILVDYLGNDAKSMLNDLNHFGETFLQQYVTRFLLTLPPAPSFTYQTHDVRYYQVDEIDRGLVQEFKHPELFFKNDSITTIYWKLRSKGAKTYGELGYRLLSPDEVVYDGRFPPYAHIKEPWDPDIAAMFTTESFTPTEPKDYKFPIPEESPEEMEAYGDFLLRESDDIGQKQKQYAQYAQRLWYRQGKPLAAANLKLYRYTDGASERDSDLQSSASMDLESYMPFQRSDQPGAAHSAVKATLELVWIPHNSFDLFKTDVNLNLLEDMFTQSLIDPCFLAVAYRQEMADCPRGFLSSKRSIGVQGTKQRVCYSFYQGAPLDRRYLAWSFEPQSLTTRAILMTPLPERRVSGFFKRLEVFSGFLSSPYVVGICNANWVTTMNESRKAVQATIEASEKVTRHDVQLGYLNDHKDGSTMRDADLVAVSEKVAGAGLECYGNKSMLSDLTSFFDHLLSEDSISGQRCCSGQF